MKRRHDWPSILLWAIYLALLAVLLPHTAWAFGRFESPVVGWLPMRQQCRTAWAAAFVFEAAIAALTHRLALFSLAFGGIQPLAPLMFPRISANTVAVIAGADGELAQAKQTIRKLRLDLEAVEGRVGDAEARASAAEQRFSAAGDLVVQLFVQEKRQRTLAAAERWPEPPAAFAAIITGASPGYPSEVLRSSDGR